MDCKRAIRLMALFPEEPSRAEGEPDVELVGELARHLEGCATCSLRSREDIRILEAIRAGAPDLINPAPALCPERAIQRAQRIEREEASVIRFLRRTATAAVLLLLSSGILTAWMISSMPRKQDGDVSLKTITITSESMRMGALINDENSILIAISGR